MRDLYRERLAHLLLRITTESVTTPILAAWLAWGFGQLALQLAVESTADGAPWVREMLAAYPLVCPGIAVQCAS
jgi:hypothetical protein